MKIPKQRIARGTSLLLSAVLTFSLFSGTMPVYAQESEPAGVVAEDGPTQYSEDGVPENADSSDNSENGQDSAKEAPEASSADNQDEQAPSTASDKNEQTAESSTGAGQNTIVAESSSEASQNDQENTNLNSSENSSDQLQNSSDANEIQITTVYTTDSSDAAVTDTSAGLIVTTDAVSQISSSEDIVISSGSAAVSTDDAVDADQTSNEITNADSTMEDAQIAAVSSDETTGVSSASTEQAADASSVLADQNTNDKNSEFASSSEPASTTVYTAQARRMMAAKKTANETGNVTIVSTNIPTMTETETYSFEPLIATVPLYWNYLWTVSTNGRVIYNESMGTVSTYKTTYQVDVSDAEIITYTAYVITRVVAGNTIFIFTDPQNADSSFATNGMATKTRISYETTVCIPFFYSDHLQYQPVGEYTEIHTDTLVPVLTSAYDKDKYSSYCAVFTVETRWSTTEVDLVLMHFSYSYTLTRTVGFDRDGKVTGIISYIDYFYDLSQSNTRMEDPWGAFSCTVKPVTYGWLVTYTQTQTNLGTESRYRITDPFYTQIAPDHSMISSMLIHGRPSDTDDIFISTTIYNVWDRPWDRYYSYSYTSYSLTESEYVSCYVTNDSTRYFRTDFAAQSGWTWVKVYQYDFYPLNTSNWRVSYVYQTFTRDANGQYSLTPYTTTYINGITDRESYASADGTTYYQYYDTTARVEAWQTHSGWYISTALRARIGHWVKITTYTNSTITTTYSTIETTVPTDSSGTTESTVSTTPGTSSTTVPSSSEETTVTTHHHSHHTDQSETTTPNTTSFNLPTTTTYPVENMVLKSVEAPKPIPVSTTEEQLVLAARKSEAAPQGGGHAVGTGDESQMYLNLMILLSSAAALCIWLAAMRKRSTR